MSRSTHRHRAQRPVFVDASGRRQQALKVAGILGVLVAVGYLCVLVSTVLGGPTIHSAFLPLPAAPPPEFVAAQHPKPVPTGSTSGPAQPSVGVVASTPTTLPTSSPTALPTSTAVPTAVPTSTTVATAAKGKPTALPTPANKPTRTTR